MRALYATVCTAIFVAATAQFADDARLAEPISLRVEAERVRSVLKRISDLTDVELSVAKPLEDDLIILYVKEKPAAEVLKIIAEHFDWNWEKRKDEDGYRLYQTSKQRKEEQRLLREQTLEPYLEMQANARKLLKEAEESDAAKLDQEVKDLEEQQRLMEGGGELYRQLSRRLEWKWAQQDPWQLFAAAAFAGLTEDQLLELDTRSRIVLSYRPTPTQHRLRTGQKEALAALAMAEERWEKEAADVLPEWRPLFGLFPPDQFGTFRVSFQRRWFGDGAQLEHALVTVIGRDGTALASSRGGRAWAPPWDPRDTAQPVVRPRNRLDDTEIDTSRMVEWMQPGPMLGQPVLWGQTVQAFMQEGSTTDLLRVPGAFLCELADKAGINLISDAYDRHPPAMPTGIRGPTPAGALLDSMRRGPWRLEGDWVKLRTADWALSRSATAPRGLLYSTRDRFVRQRGLTLDQLADFVANLSDRQAVSAGAAFVGAGAFIFRGETALYALRIWASLSPVQRNALRRGEPIAYASLRPPSMWLYGEAVFRLTNTIYDGFSEARGAEERADREWVLANWNYEPYTFRDWEITQLLPSGPVSGSVFHARVAKRDALMLMMRGVPRYARALSWLAVSFLQSEVRSLDEMYRGFYTFVPATLERAIFTFRPVPGSDFAWGVSAETAVALPGAMATDYEGLPQAIK
ncbi:MAG: hypothetical protein IH851_10210, partial [Armatimonadetes bacterium]|nr:hypothetical protein [Armatimonadota bacterium]